MAGRNKEYRKESNPLLVILYIVAILALLACIAYFIYSSWQEKAKYEESVRNAAEYETERQTIRREEESESESAAETEAETEESAETESEEETGDGESEEEPEETKGDEPEETAENDLAGGAEEGETEEAVSASGVNRTEEGETETETEPYVPEGYPKLILRQKKVVLQVGDTFVAEDYVKNITGGSDNYYELYRNIQVEGSYDMSRAGIYQLIYYVVDSSGHSSNRAVLLLEVQDPQTEAKDETAETETAKTDGRD